MLQSNLNVYSVVLDLNCLNIGPIFRHIRINRDKQPLASLNVSVCLSTCISVAMLDVFL